MYYVNRNFYFQSLSVAIKGLIHPTKQVFTPRSGQMDAAPSIFWHLVGSGSGGSFLEQLLEILQRCSVPQHSALVWTKILNIQVEGLFEYKGLIWHFTT